MEVCNTFLCWCAAPIDPEKDDPEYKEMEAAVDREWYDQEEGGGGVDESHNPFVGDDALFEKRSTEMAKKMVIPFLPPLPPPF